MIEKKKTRIERIDEKCPICRVILFTREIIIDETTDKNGSKANNIISEKIINREPYGSIMDNIRNDHFFLCMNHFKMVWESFKEKRFTPFREIIQGIMYDD
jgi:hypothetical protein